MNFVSKKRRSSGPKSNSGGGAEGAHPEHSSSDFEVEDSALVVSDEGEIDHEGNERPTLSPNMIDESMILSDEEEAGFHVRCDVRV